MLKVKFLTGLLFFGICLSAFAQTPKQLSKILITDVSIFNGKDDKITKANILIEGNLIKTISQNPIPTDRSGNTLMTL